MKSMSKSDRKEKLRQRVVIILKSIESFRRNGVVHAGSLSMKELEAMQKMFHNRMDEIFQRMAEVIDEDNIQSVPKKEFRFEDLADVELS